MLYNGWHKNQMSLTVKKKLFGIGVNDVEYQVQLYENVGKNEKGCLVRKLVWICPFYRRWKSMLMRCYSEKYKNKHQSYTNCSCVEEWHYLSNFKAWMETQDWQGKQLDKDLLIAGNKIYSPDTCLFVPKNVNLFLLEGCFIERDLPIGVRFEKRSGNFTAVCNDIYTGKSRHLGTFYSANDAHQAWLTFKLEQAKILASEQTDERVAKALINKYTNYC